MRSTTLALVGVLAAALGLWLWSRSSTGQVTIVDAIEDLARRARELISGEEGLRLTVYQDTGGVWTVGYGHVVKPSDGLYPYTERRVITQAEAEDFFDADTAIASRAVSQGVRVPITTAQRSALVSLVFNIGAEAFRGSTLLRKLNAGDVSGAADEFLRWVYDNGVRVGGLVARRERERAIFLS